MTDLEKLKIAQDTISELEKEILKIEDREKSILLTSEKKDLVILQLRAKIEVYCDVIDAVLKDLKGDR